jgi:hypothetical protein
LEVAKPDVPVGIKIEKSKLTCDVVRVQLEKVKAAGYSRQKLVVMLASYLKRQILHAKSKCKNEKSRSCLRQQVKAGCNTRYLLCKAGSDCKSRARICKAGFCCEM